MGFLKGFIACGLVAIALFLIAPDITRAEDVLIIRYGDGSSQRIRLDRPSESIRQIEFSDEKRGAWREGPAQPSIRIVAATYGRNCGAQYGNVTSHLAAACDGKTTCRYSINYRSIGDPNPGCPKDYLAEWQCGNHPQRERISVNPEAGDGTVIELRCAVR